MIRYIITITLLYKVTKWKNLRFHYCEFLKYPRKVVLKLHWDKKKIRQELSFIAVTCKWITWQNLPRGVAYIIHCMKNSTNTSTVFLKSCRNLDFRISKWHCVAKNFQKIGKHQPLREIGEFDLKCISSGDLVSKPQDVTWDLFHCSK